MKFTDLLREAAAVPEELNKTELFHLLVTAADIIEKQSVYKLKWAEVAGRCATLEKENESLLAQIQTIKDV